MRKERNTTDFSKANDRGRETKSNESKSLNLNFSQEKNPRGKKALSFTQISSFTGQELSRQSLLQSHLQYLFQYLSGEGFPHEKHQVCSQPTQIPGSEIHLPSHPSRPLFPGVPSSHFCTLASLQLTLLPPFSQPGARTLHPK